jgi:STE24 endopeptidase
VLLDEIGGLPIAFYSGFLLERKYGLSDQSFKGWLRDQAKSIALVAVLATAAVVLLYGIIRLFPNTWWLVAGATFALVTAGLARIGPVVLLPLFYPVKRLARESLTARLLALADRAGASVLGVYEWGISAKTRKANAALAGLGATRRILVSDTMLAAYSDDEVEVVLAHELAHHVHGDIWKGLALQSCLIVAGFLGAARLLSLAQASLGLAGPADVAGLPLLLLAFGAVSIVARPAQLAFSRFCERRADRFALALTGNPRAFISAMRRLSAQNLAEAQPSTLVRWLFYSHPPIEERLASARSFEGHLTAGVDSAFGRTPRHEF